MVTRKSTAASSAAEKQKFVQTILKMKSQGLYDLYVQWHSQSMQMMSAHMGPAFLRHLAMRLRRPDPTMAPLEGFRGSDRRDFRASSAEDPRRQWKLSWHG
jgi:hypothetical protein